MVPKMIEHIKILHYVNLQISGIVQVNTNSAWKLKILDV